MRLWSIILLSPVLLAGISFLFLVRPIGNLVEASFSVPCIESSGDAAIVDSGAQSSEKSRELRSEEEFLLAQQAALSLVGDRVVIWVHGFKTSSEEAGCAARSLDMALTEQGLEASVLAFVWPSQFELTDFSLAEAMAVKAGSHLAKILNNLGDRQVAIVTHSLGARVALEAIKKAEITKEKRLNLLYMIQPAVAATSVRRAILDFTCIPSFSGETMYYSNFPADSMCSTNGDRTQKFFVGCYAKAILRVSSLRVTVGDQDPVLGGPFALQHGADDECYGPLLPPVLGIPGTKLPQNLALGSIWQDQHGPCSTYELKIDLKLPKDQFQANRNYHPYDDDFQPLSIDGREENGLGPCIEYVSSKFYIVHPDYQTVPLSRLRYSLWFGNNHSPHHVLEALSSIAEEIQKLMMKRS